VPLEAAVDEVKLLLRARHHLAWRDPDDFSIATADGVRNIWRSLTDRIFAVALFVVGISLLVGGIVIMNIMLVSVAERTREIGLRKALGARDRDVQLQFLVESLTIACAGGALGVLLGLLLAMAIGALTPLPISFPLLGPPLAIGLCLVVGVVFGLHPARRAARLSPIEALRTE
jgi:putative ABC transport system permease protein